MREVYLKNDACAHKYFEQACIHTSTYTYACIVRVAHQSSRTDQQVSGKIETGARLRPCGYDEAYGVMLLIVAQIAEIARLFKVASI